MVLLLAAPLIGLASTCLASPASFDTGGVAGNEILRAIGLLGGNDDESHLAFRLGVAFDLHGQGAEALDGVRLAVAQIAAANGPKIEPVVEDVGHPGAWLGENAEQALRSAGTPLALVSGGAAGGTMVAGLERDHILAFDGDRGVATENGQAFLWGLRASVPDDDIPVGLQYLIEAYPRVRHVALVYSAINGEAASLERTFALALSDDGLDLASVSAWPQSASSLAIGLRNTRPDAIYVVDADAAAVLKAAREAGLEVPVLGSDGPSPIADLSPLDGYIFATDWFDATHPENDWAKIFVKSYEARFGVAPGTGAANAYEDTFAVWTLVRRVVARGGDINDGARLQQELLANHAFKSLYGGDGSDLDQIALDPHTHGVVERRFSVYRIRAGALRRLATSDIGGANFNLDSL